MQPEKTDKAGEEIQKSPPEATEAKSKEEEFERAHKLLFDRLDALWNEHYLNEFQKAAANHFVKNFLSDKNNPKTVRVREWILNKINGKKTVSQHEWQKGCGQIFPGLRGHPWWDELISLRDQKGFQPYRGPSWMTEHKAKDGVGSESHDSGNWNVFYLMLHDMKFDINCEKVPKTIKLIEKYLPRNYHHCFFSAVTQKTHIIKHHGPTNKKLRFHMPLMGVKGSRLRVANETKEQVLGKAYVFDDSFEHEAWHDGDETRIILIADFWHPDFSDEQIRFLKFLQGCQMRFEKKISEKDPQKDNFYSIIESAKTLIENNNWWVVNQEVKKNVQ